MNNKGFTLVEVLSVIVVLGIVITITSVGILHSNKKVRANMFNNKILNIEKAAVLFGQDANIADFQYDYCLSLSDNVCNGINKCYCYKEKIKANDLINEGYLKGDEEGNNDIIDPRDETKKLNNCDVVIYEKYGKKYAFVLDEGNCKK